MVLALLLRLGELSTFLVLEDKRQRVVSREATKAQRGRARQTKDDMDFSAHLERRRWEWVPSMYTVTISPSRSRGHGASREVRGGETYGRGVDPEARRGGRLGRPVGGHEHRSETPLATAFRRGGPGGLLLQRLPPEGAAEPAGGARAHDLAADGVAYEDDRERGVRGAGQWEEISVYREVTGGIAGGIELGAATCLTPILPARWKA